jgi:hypothetical protein
MPAANRPRVPFRLSAGCAGPGVNHKHMLGPYWTSYQGKPLAGQPPCGDHVAKNILPAARDVQEATARLQAASCNMQSRQQTPSTHASHPETQPVSSPLSYLPANISLRNATPARCWLFQEGEEHCPAHTTADPSPWLQHRQPFHHTNRQLELTTVL